MIAKTILAKHGRGSFRNCVDYIFGRGPEADPSRAINVWMRGVLSDETAAAEMSAMATLNRRAYDVVAHLIIGYAKDEHPTIEQQQADIERLLTNLDMEDHQYIAVGHGDTDDGHIHIIVNRIGPDGRCAKSSWDHAIRERTCAEIAGERGWLIVKGRFNADIVKAHNLDYQGPERRLTDGEFQRSQQTGELPWQDVARTTIQTAVAEATSWDDLRARLAAEGIIVKHPLKSGKDGKVYHGLAFAEGEAKDAPGCAASRIGDDCKYGALEKRFGPWTDPAQAVPPTPLEPLRQRCVSINPPKSLVADPIWIADNLILRSLYNKCCAANKARNTQSREFRRQAWAAERTSRRTGTAARRDAYRARRRAAMARYAPGIGRTMALHAIDYSAQWTRRYEMRMVKRLWAQKKKDIAKTHPIPPRPSFRAFLQSRGDDPLACRHLAWLTGKTRRSAQVQSGAREPVPTAEAGIQKLVTPIGATRMNSADAPPHSSTAESKIKTSPPSTQAADEMVHIRRHTEHLLIQFKDAKAIYSDKTKKLEQRLTAACNAYVLFAKISGRLPSGRSEPWPIIEQIVARHVAVVKDEALLPFLTHLSANSKWGKSLADKIGAALPVNDSPSLRNRAREETSIFFDPKSTPAEHSLAALWRLAIAETRGESEAAIGIHRQLLKQALNRIKTSNDRETLRFSVKQDSIIPSNASAEMLTCHGHFRKIGKTALDDLLSTHKNQQSAIRISGLETTR